MPKVLPVGHFYIAVVDVVDGSKLAKELGPADFVEWLDGLRAFCGRVIKSKLKNYRALPWALDGGVFLAEELDSDVAEKLVDACATMLRTAPTEAPLPGASQGYKKFQLRVCIDKGRVCYPRGKGLQKGDFEIAYGEEMSALLKYERALGKAGELTITENVRKYLRANVRRLLKQAQRPSWKGSTPYVLPVKKDRRFTNLVRARAKYSPINPFAKYMTLATKAESKKQWRVAVMSYQNALSINRTSAEAAEALRRCQARVNARRK